MIFNTTLRLAGPALALAVLSGTLAGQEPPQRSITPVTDNLYRVQNDIHFTTFLVTPEGIVLTDPLNREFATWLKGQLAQRFGVPVKYVLYSHHHWDHASGGDVFADTARFVGHENMLAHLAMPPADTGFPGDVAGMDVNGDGKITRAEADGRLQAIFESYDEDGDGQLTGAEVVRGPVADVRPPDITFRDTATVALGGHRVELSWTGPVTHTDDMSVIRYPDEDAVYVVDFISIEAMPYRTMGDAYFDEWLQAIRKVEDMSYSTVLPGHGVIGDKSDVAAHRRYLEQLRDAVQAGIDEGASLDELKQSVRLDQYQDWFMYDQWRAENVEGMYKLLKNRN